MARKSRKTVIDALAVKDASPLMYRAAAYVRLSVEDNHHKGDSIENQKAILKNYIDMSPDIELEAFYIDNGNSGMNYNRPAFERMLADAEQGKINCILTKDLSRLGRNGIDTGYYIEKHFPSIGVRYIAVNDNVDSEQLNDSGAGIMMHLKNLINEAYALDISRKIKAQQNEAMHAGEFIGARPPYGYLKAANNCHKLVIDPLTAPIVRQIFSWAADGISKNDIVRKLNEAKIMTPSHYRKAQGLITHDNLIGNGVWQTFTVNRILHDEIYCGDMVQGKSRSVMHKQTPTDEKDWIRVTGTHEPVVTREVFNKVQKLLKAREEACKSRAKKPYTPNIFKGKVFCGVCGSGLHRHRAYRVKGPDVYRFNCLSNSRKARESCVPYSMKEKELEEMLLLMIQNQVEALTGTALKLRSNNSALHLERERLQAELRELRSLLGKNEKMLRNLYESMLANLITSEEYRQMRYSYEMKTHDGGARISALEEKLSTLDRQVEEYCTMADMAAGAGDTGITANLIEALVEQIRIYPEHRIEVDFKFSSCFGELYEVMAHE